MSSLTSNLITLYHFADCDIIGLPFFFLIGGGCVSW
nr:MAG TPA: Cytochrome c oxidase assembly protein [Bacteriophage sp.]